MLGPGGASAAQLESSPRDQNLALAFRLDTLWSKVRVQAPLSFMMACSVCEEGVGTGQQIHEHSTCSR